VRSPVRTFEHTPPGGAGLSGVEINSMVWPAASISVYGAPAPRRKAAASPPIDHRKRRSPHKAEWIVQLLHHFEMVGAHDRKIAHILASFF